ncbi:alginate lyase family protein [Pseudomonas sp. 102515]|uniref:alginate lyase family protein n=1 Tax=Pseudomonas sp. 102515 TaxID=3071568 RepID=UPI002802C016|nr:alginate lyase family protein [Pseudomonas sp. 102515]MDQ7913053.1 alginate lyase family protein [Pseudomonas sp. 102515]
MLYLALAAAPGHTTCLAARPPSAAALAQAVDHPPAGWPPALPVIHTAGTLPHTGIHDQSAAAVRDFGYMLDLALAWRDSRDAAVLARLASYLDAWLPRYRPSFQPIDETSLGSLIVAYRLTAADLPLATARRSRAFIETLAEGYLQQMEAHRGDTHGIWSDNWQSHRIKLATLAAGALDDPALFARARATFVAQLSVNLKPDGEVLDFGERDALHYVVYDLEPLVLAAAVAQGRGEDWLHLPGAEGQTLARALDWLLPYALGQHSHEEFRKTRVRFDLQRAEAGLPGYAGPWDPQGARNLYWPASLLDPRYASVARQLAATPSRMLWAYAPACQG